MHVRMYACTSVRLYVRLSVRPSVCLSVCMYTVYVSMDKWKVEPWDNPPVSGWGLSDKGRITLNTNTLSFVIQPEHLP